MTTWRKGWKVIKKEKRTSAWSSKPVVYEKGKKTTPEKNNGPLAVFTSRKYAEWFRDGMFSEIAVPCKYIPSDYTSMWYWDNQNRKISKVMTVYGWPTGTKLADAVVCLE